MEPVEVRMQDIVLALRKNKIHAAKCRAGHNCDRDHPTTDVYHSPEPCTCWVESDDIIFIINTN